MRAGPDPHEPTLHRDTLVLRLKTGVPCACGRYALQKETSTSEAKEKTTIDVGHKWTQSTL